MAKSTSQVFLGYAVPCAASFAGNELGLTTITAAQVVSIFSYCTITTALFLAVIRWAPVIDGRFMRLFPLLQLMNWAVINAYFVYALDQMRSLDLVFAFIALSFVLLQNGGFLGALVQNGCAAASYFIGAHYGIERAGQHGSMSRTALEVACMFVAGMFLAYVAQLYTEQRRVVRKQQVELLSAKRRAEELHANALRDAAQLRELAQQKTTFFQNISHELRTPLTLILAPLEHEQALQRDNRNVAVALKNGRRLLRLVNQLLEFQKLEAGHRRITLEPTNLTQFACICGDYFASACSTKGIDLTLTFDGAPLDRRETLTIEAEADALEKVAFNYLSNALKYTPAGGRIELGLQTVDDGARVRLFVRDSGRGIDAADQGELFKLFSQVEGTTTREYEGTGLGLALVKSLVEKMNGEVGVESALGAGSTFFATFPVVRDRRPSAVFSAVEQRLSTRFEVRPWLLATDGMTGVEDNKQDVERNATAGAEGGDVTVLVVDDLEDLRELVALMLEERGYRVLRASNGEHALGVLQSRSIDLVVTDWMMPKMSGVELVARMRIDERLKGIPVVLLTAKSDEESKLLGSDVGADVFLGKPFNAQELGSTVRNLLALKAKEREVRILNRHITEAILKRYVPPQLVEDALAGRWSMDGSPAMIPLTILFADLVGFTAASEKLGAIEVAKALNEHLEAITEIVFAYGGTIDKFIGDAVMVIFGAPRPMDARDQVSNAVLCAIAMQQQRDRLSARQEQGAPRGFRMRIGIHHGEALVGNFGSHRRVDFTAIGPTVNLAARIEAACEPGEIFVSEQVRDLLGNAIATSPAGSFSLKGIGAEIPLARIDFRRCE